MFRIPHFNPVSNIEACYNNDVNDVTSPHVGLYIKLESGYRVPTVTLEEFSHDFSILNLLIWRVAELAVC